MPITARLSKRFYEAFGDEIVNELVEWLNQVDLAFRSELRDAHELGLQRLEAKVDQRFAELRAEVKEEIAALRAETKAGLAAGRAEAKDDVRSLQVSIRDLKAELIKWMFLFWVGTVGLTLATRFLR